MKVGELIRLLEEDGWRLASGVAPVRWRVNCFRDHADTKACFSNAIGER
jgi:hypothetical protein